MKSDLRSAGKKAKWIAIWVLVRESLGRFYCEAVVVLPVELRTEGIRQSKELAGIQADRFIGRSWMQEHSATRQTSRSLI